MNREPDNLESGQRYAQVIPGKQEGDWRFVVKAQNGEVVATSETYQSKEAALAEVKKQGLSYQVLEGAE